jgi:hypothetical protein
MFFHVPETLKVQQNPCVVAHTCNTSSWKTKAGGLQIQVQPGLHTEFQASLGSTARPCLKKTRACHDG